MTSRPMEPKHRTLIQAAAIALVLALIVVTHEPPVSEVASHAFFAVQK